MSQVRAGGATPSRETGGATHFVLGGEHVGRALAEQLRADGRRVVTVDESHESDTVPGVVGDPADARVLAEAGMGADSTAVVATRSDRRNLLVAQLVRARFDVRRTVVLVNDPERVSLFAAAGHEPFCVTTALSGALGEAV